MPFPMVHLAVSVQLFELVKMEPNADFLLGCLSPDSIHMRTGATREAKSTTHLRLLPLNIVPDGFDKQSQFKAFIDANDTGDQTRRAFLYGYISHILTDLYWLHSLHRLFRDRIPDGMSAQDKKKLYTLERSQLDYNLYNNAEWSASICSLVMSGQGFDLSEQMLTSQEISGWRDQVILAFTKQPKPNIVTQYITVAEVEGFVRDAADRLVNDFSMMGIDLSP
jgi:hypothetical protein